MKLLDELQEHVVCGDGAMGTLLLDQGLPMESCLEEVCVSDPDRVRAIHHDYVSAGARVIETNTFGANAARLSRFGFENRVSEFNHAAAELAKETAAGKDICVAGSVGPLGISALEAEERGFDPAQCFHEQIQALLEGGVDLIFLETFMDDVELRIALEAKHALTDCTTICSFACEPEGRLASGVPIVDAFRKLRGLGAQITGVNCMNGPHATVQLLQRIPIGGLLAAYPNAGYPKHTGGRFIYHAAPDYFAQAAREMVVAGARLIGGCCGTTPRTIAAISKAIAELKPVKVKAVTGDAAARSEGGIRPNLGSRSPKRRQMCDVKQRGATTDLPFLPGTQVC
jgi:homocysteine S-methyltransferase